jgi:heterodisulfide reductase subunit A
MYNQGMRDRKAIFIDYAQAVPLSFTIDQETCIGCGLCEKMCLAKAITYADQPMEKSLHVGAVALSVGTRPFDPSELDYLGYGRFPNVVTSMEFERILSASGPYFGNLMRPLDRQEPRKIAWLQCVGSRDMNRCQNAHCSSVCCMYAIKEAVIAKEHATGELDCAVFYMDMRTYGKDFERYYDHARDEEGVRFIRSRVHTIVEDPETGDLHLSFVDDQGQMSRETFDMVVLSVGLEADPQSMELARKLGVELTEGNFCRTSSFAPISTSKDGVYVCGAFQGPKDIPTSVVDASAASALAGEALNEARFQDAEVKEGVPEKNVQGERPSIGVFVCKCGSNIAGVVNVEEVRDYAASLPYVDYATDNLYTCSQNTQDEMTEIIKEKNLNRVIVASCSPKTHEPLFQETLINAGINKYLFSMVNIRNQDSWVHRFNPDLATQKAKDLVRMAVSNVALKEPLEEPELSVDQTALVIGGGISGMTAALSLARQGHPTHLVEKNSQLGGQALSLYRTWKGEDIQADLALMITEVENEPQLTVHLDSSITDVDGFVGNFNTTVSGGGSEQTITHGVTVMATGATELKPEEYLYGQDSRVKTSLELDRMFLEDDPALKEVKSAVFIQCVGSREPHRPYCSRVCCTHSIQNALELKEKNPDMDVFVLYRDIRTYGEKESIYNQARKAGVIFIRYDLDHKPEVEQAGDSLIVTVRDHVLNQPLAIQADLLTLASAIVPVKDETLANFYKVSFTDDGFYAERHAKMGPSEFATDGMFLCGLAHYPKSIDESVAQGKAAAAKAITMLAQEIIHSSGEVAQVNPMYCSSCGVCVSICPYSAPSFIEEGRFAGKAQINPSLCKGCGLCAASCRSGAISLKGANGQQIYAMIEAL